MTVDTQFGLNYNKYINIDLWSQEMMKSTDEQAAIFGALADPTRLKLLKLLCNQQDPDALCVNALTGLLGITQPAVSQHLKVLKSIGLVTGQRRGYHIHYSVSQERIEQCRELVTEALSLGKQVGGDPCKNCKG
jgi:ArsR family transcriptional regulator